MTISFPAQWKVGMPLSVRCRSPELSKLLLIHICVLRDLKKNVFQINTYFRKGTPQLVTWNSLSACRSNSLESIKTPKGTPCSPLNLLVLLLSRQSLPIPPSPPFLSFVLISSKACDFLPQHIAFHAAEQLSSASARKTAQPQTPLRPALTSVRDPNKQAHRSKLVKACCQY